MAKFKKPALIVANDSPGAEVIELDTCQDCIFWTESETGPAPEIGAPKAGRCGGLPPIPFPVMDPQGNPLGVRSVPWMTRADMPACALFDPGEFDDDGEPIN